MKSKKLLIALLATLFVAPSFGQDKIADKDKDLYDFAVPVIEAAKPVDDKKVEVVAEVKKEEITKEAKELSLVADAQALIRDKLIQKYQVRLDEVIDRLGSKLAAVSVDTQRTALNNLRKTISDRKTLVLERKDLDQSKRDIILAILDHVIYRVDGLIKQSATHTGDELKIRA